MTATLGNRGRVVHGYPATRDRDDALALLRRETEAGAVPMGQTRTELREANAAALRELHLVEMRAELEDEEAR